jgi:L-arabinose isomerase
MITTNMNKKGKVSVMVVGHREYWSQFPELRGRLLKNAEGFESLLKKQGVEVVRFTADDGTQMCDSPELSYKAGVYFKTQDVDLVFLFLTCYVASGRYMQGVLACPAPVVVVGYQKVRDFAKATMFDENAGGGACPVPEACNALTRCLKSPAGVVFGEYYGDGGFAPHFEKDISDWCRVANTLRMYRGAIFGHMGHSYEGMLDMNFDPTTFTRTFGVHIRMVEMCELAKYVQEASEDEVRTKLDVMHDTFEFLDASYDPTTVPIKDEDVEWAARCSVGLDKLVEKNGLSGMAYYYEGRDNYYERVASNLIVGNSLLVSKGCSLAGESDMKTCLAMYTTSALGAGGSFAELCATSFAENVILVGHDGPHDIRISDAKPTIRGLGLYHGKRGHGISVEFSLKSGPMTMLGLGCDENGQFSFIVAEGESQKGVVPKQGNTLTRGYFGDDISKFVQDWSNAGNNHHYSLSIGHNASAIEKLAKALGIGYMRVR